MNVSPLDVLQYAWSIIGAVVGTLGVLAGVMLSTWNSRRQLRIQHEHDWRRDKLAREMEMRREVYMDASVALARTTAVLTQMADVTRNSDELARQFETDTAAIGKLHVIAGPETIEAIMAFTCELASARAELGLLRAPVLAREEQIESESLPAGKAAPLATMQSQAKLDLAERAMKWGRKVAERIPPVVFAMRRELDMPIDREAYRESFEKSWSRIEETLRASIDRIRAESAARRVG